LDKPLTLYVYNHEYDVTRPLEITPTRTWGGQGALGCTLGYGALHKIPATLGEPPSAPGETMFETPLDEKHSLEGASATEAESAFEGIVPAELIAPPPISYVAPSKKGKKQRNTNISPSAEMEDYFREEEEKSRKEDRAPVSKGSGIPPPPKVNSPAPPSQKG